MTTLPQTTSIRLPCPVGTGPMAVPATIGPAGGSSTAMSGADAWRVVRANLWLIIGSLLLAGLIGYGVNWFLARNYSRYTATGFVQITPTRAPNILNADQGGDQIDTNMIGFEQRTQANLLKGEPLLQKVLTESAAVRATDWFKQFIKTPGGTPDIAAAKDDLMEHLSVVPLQDTKIISVQMTYRVRGDTKTIVEEVVNQHLENQYNNRSAR